MKTLNAIIIFTDIRGFTKWAEGIEAFQYIDKFIDRFYKILNQCFSGSYLKQLGDVNCTPFLRQPVSLE